VNYYSYKAIAANGDIVTGTVEADSAEAVDTILSARALYLLQVKKTGKFVTQLQTRYKARGIKRKDIIEFSSNLSVMIKGGVPILNALDDIVSTCANKYFRSIIAEVRQTIEMGSTFTDALRNHRAVFPDVMIRLVMVGEETGRFEESLANVAKHLQKVQDLTDTVKRAMVYPVFAIVTTGGALVFWLAYVLPKVMQVIVSLNVPMPLLTRILYAVSKFTEHYWYVLLLVPAAPFLIVQLMKLRPASRYQWDRIKINLPIVKLLVHNKLIAHFSEQMRILISAGIPIDRTLDVVAEVMGNAVFMKAILQVKEDIMAGSRISEALRLHPVFPPLVIRMVDVGETSGSLEEQFGFLAEQYFKKVDDVSDRLGKMIEPIVLMVIGAMLGLMIVGVLLPVYDIFSKIGP
jgi:type II secretory pathway component PulF